MVEFSNADWQAIWLTFKLAAAVTFILLIICTPLAYWLNKTKSIFKGPLIALFALPLVLPPSVLGFYFLLAFAPNTWFSQAALALGFGQLAFSFTGLLIASLIYSLPFVLQPIYNAMQSLHTGSLDAAATLGAGPLDRFFTLVIPMIKPGLFTGAVLGFAHTLGEFGVVLMIGGNIPGETQLISVQIYEYVESLEYGKAHFLSGFMLIVSFIILWLVYKLQPSRVHE
ncbi:molybdate ABC transporter permease subunit [Gayadomonas joobiniege]|uniref:molybdate ABC transporter permease subunit n=1 Tax=Gayadomonas joobiniege TaxID=1234606 RepID=UPI00036C9332|nr:molybdate ABC transporter permease subunit [Gayadomonas joobiniege]